MCPPRKGSKKSLKLKGLPDAKGGPSEKLLLNLVNFFAFSFFEWFLVFLTLLGYKTPLLYLHHITRRLGMQCKPGSSLWPGPQKREKIKYVEEIKFSFAENMRPWRAANTKTGN